MRVSVGEAGLAHSGWRKREERTARRQSGRVGEGIEEGSRETLERRGWITRWKGGLGRREWRDDLGNSP
jgi:hypothetical protein